MQYVVLLPAAGVGSRVSATGNLPKPVRSAGVEPHFARIISGYPKDWRFVVAVGHMGETVEELIRAYYAGRDDSPQIDFVRTQSFRDGGLRRTLLDSRAALGERPFVFHASDSLLLGRARNWWSGLQEKNQVLAGVPLTSGQYRVVNAATDAWVRKSFSGADVGEHAYVGVAHIFDVEAFWRRLEAAISNEEGEVSGLSPQSLTWLTIGPGDWLDVGSPAGEDLAHQRLADPDVHLLPKRDECLWIGNGLVTKVFLNPSLVSGRVARAKHLDGWVPRLQGVTPHTYTYRFAEGVTASRAISGDEYSIDEILECLAGFWFSDLAGESGAPSGQDLMDFYRGKTEQRIADLLRERPDAADCTGPLRGIGTLENQLSSLAWAELTSPLVGRVHGDCHPDNLVVGPQGRIVMLDWRQDFAGSLGGLGDVYYDFGKMLHGLRVDHELVARGRFEVEKVADTWSISLTLDPRKADAYNRMLEWLETRGYSAWRAQHIEALIYFSIAALHSPPSYQNLLVLLGRHVLSGLSGIDGSRFLELSATDRLSWTVETIRENGL